MGNNVITPAAESVITAIADAWDVDVDALRNPRSNREKQARHAAIYLLKTYANGSLRSICDLLDIIDNTTVYYGVKRTQERMVDDWQFAWRMAKVLDQIGVQHDPR